MTHDDSPLMTHEVPNPWHALELFVSSELDNPHPITTRALLRKYGTVSMYRYRTGMFDVGSDRLFFIAKRYIR
jgi:hypothetical protein